MTLLFLQQQYRIRVLCGALLSATLMLLTGCGAPVMKPEQASTIKTVGIVSLLPSELSYQKIGITVFNNEYAKRPVGDAFNSAARFGAERALKLSGRNVVQLEVDVPTLAKRIRSGKLHFDSPAEYIHDELRALVEKYKLDAIVLIIESFDAENGINGIRMFFRAGFGNIETAIGMPHVATLAVDTKIKKLAYGGRGISFTAKRPDGLPWVYKLEENLDATTHDYISRLIQNGIEDTVTRDIRTMGF